MYIQQLIDRASRAGHSNRLICGVMQGEIPDLSVIDSRETSCIEFGKGRAVEKVVGMSDEMPYPSVRFRDLNQADIGRYENTFAKVLLEVIADFQPDIIHSHHLWLISSLTARLFPKIPLVTTCHGSDLRQFRTCPHLQARVLSGCRNISTVFALSEPQKEEIHTLYGIKREKICVVGAGYNSELFYQEKKQSPSPVRLIYAGKLSYAKGVPYLLKALTGMKEIDFHLDLIGSGNGPEHDECLLLARKLSNTITVHGSIPQAQLAALMRNCHIMILPSLYEGLPLIMLEAIASGCRVIATELPGTREIMNHLPTSYITLIPPPERLEVDKIPTADQSAFITNLQETIACVIPQVSKQPDPDLTSLSKRIDYFNWDKVFSRCEKTYTKLTVTT